MKNLLLLVFLLYCHKIVGQSPLDYTHPGNIGVIGTFVNDYSRHLYGTKADFKPQIKYTLNDPEPAYMYVSVFYPLATLSFLDQLQRHIDGTYAELESARTVTIDEIVNEVKAARYNLIQDKIDHLKNLLDRSSIINSTRFQIYGSFARLYVAHLQWSNHPSSNDSNLKKGDKNDEILRFEIEKIRANHEIMQKEIEVLRRDYERLDKTANILLDKVQNLETKQRVQEMVNECKLKYDVAAEITGGVTGALTSTWLVSPSIPPVYMVPATVATGLTASQIAVAGVIVGIMIRGFSKVVIDKYCAEYGAQQERLYREQLKSNQDKKDNADREKQTGGGGGKNLETIDVDTKQDNKQDTKQDTKQDIKQDIKQDNKQDAKQDRKGEKVDIGPLLKLNIDDYGDVGPLIRYSDPVYDWTTFNSSDGRIYHKIGKNFSPLEWETHVGDGMDYMMFGPYVDLARTGAGTYVVEWEIMVDNHTAFNADILKVDVNETYGEGTNARSRVLAEKIFTRHSWADSNKYEKKSLTFSIDASQANHRFEFRVLTYNTSYIRVQNIKVVRVPD